MVSRGGRIRKAAPLLLPLATDPSPAGFDHRVAEQVDAHPDAIVPRDIMGRVQGAQVDQPERRCVLHFRKIGVSALPVLQLV